MKVFHTDPRKTLALAILSQDPDIIGRRKELLDNWIKEEKAIEWVLFYHKKIQELVSRMDDVPRDFNPFRISKASDKVRDSYIYIVKKLLDAKIAKASLALDWSIDREGSADNSLWLQEGATSDIMDDLSEEEPTFGKYHIYMDKWLGNGLRLRKLRERRVKSEHTPFICVWVGDSLFFNIQDILMEWVKKEYHNNSYIGRAIGIFSQMVQIKLRERLYTEDTDYAIWSWKQRENVEFDMNEIYKILHELQFQSDTRHLIFDRENGNMLWSHIFEWDDTVVVGISEFYILEVLFGWSRVETMTHFSHRFSELSDKISIVEKEIASYGGEFSFRKSQLKKVLKDYKKFQRELSVIIKSGSLGKIGAYLESKGLWNINTPEDIFEESFFKWINAQDNSSRPDLNERIKLSFHDFFKGYFTDIKKKLFIWHAERFKFITSTRSDSHEDERTFLQDIWYNMQMLAPGGVLLSDGISESFTWLHRLESIYWQVERYNNQTTQDSEKCILKVLFDTKNHRIQSIAILKGREDASIVEKYLNEGIEIQTPDDALGNISVYIEQELRKIVIWSENKVHRLKWKHWAIPVAIKEILHRLKMDPTDTINDDLIRESVLGEVKDFVKEQQDFFSQLEPVE